MWRSANHPLAKRNDGGLLSLAKTNLKRFNVCLRYTSDGKDEIIIKGGEEHERSQE